MTVGVPKEIKADECHLALLPVGAQLLVQDGRIVNAAVAGVFPDLKGTPPVGA